MANGYDNHINMVENSSKQKIDSWIIESFIYILNKDNSAKSINLTGGNLYTKDKAAKIMVEKGLAPTNKYGCIGCRFCTLEGDLYRYYEKLIK